MAKYTAYFYNKCGNKETTICSSDNLEECAKGAYEYIDDHGQLYGDSKSTILENLTTRNFYVCGYGDTSVEIREE